MANWGKISSRGDVEDRRSLGPIAVGSVSLTTFALLVVANYLLGGDMSSLLRQLQQVPVEQRQAVANPEYEGEDSYEVFASTVLGSNNDLWTKIFNQHNLTYTPPKLVLFRQATKSECGVATSQVGPHYCPYDQTIYLDETFFDELKYRFKAVGGDVAEAYVISHEVGHHVQNQLDTLDKVQAGTGQRANQLSIKLELQADCFAGMWANSIKDKDVMEPGEIREAMDAAAAVGDDRIQETVSGYVNPESWTHGSAEQRLSWFTTGYDKGSMDACDTFKK